MNSVELGSVAKLIRGVTFKPSDRYETFNKNTLVCMRTKNVQKTLDESDLIFIDKDIVKNDEKILKAGDLLVSSANSWNLVGKCCYVGHLKYRATAGGFISILRAGREVYSKYLYWWFSSSRIQVEVRSFGNRTTNISNLDHKRTLRLKIPLPPLEEQKRIAAILDAADGLRTKRRESIAELDKFLQATFIDMFGDPVTNPKGWEKVLLKNSVKGNFTNGLSPSSRGTIRHSVLTLSSITSGQFRGSEKKEALLDKIPTEKQMVKKGRFLVCRGNGNKNLVGVGCYLRVDSVGTCYPDTVIGFEIDEKKFVPGFFALQWATTRVRSQILKNARTTNGTFKINQKSLCGIALLKPPLELQQKFASIVEAVERQKARMRRHLAELDDLFASLQQRAFNGEL